MFEPVSERDARNHSTGSFREAFGTGSGYSRNIYFSYNNNFHAPCAPMVIFVNQVILRNSAPDLNPLESFHHLAPSIAVIEIGTSRELDE